MKKDNNQKKSKAGIYLWKLIVIITAIFAIVLSTECFFLIEKTVKEIIGGSLEKHNTSMLVETEETPAESDDIENKDESSIESFDSTQTETDNEGSENDNPVINDSTNTPNDDSTNTGEGDTTNTAQTNTDTDTNTEIDSKDTNTAENSTSDLDEISDDESEDKIDNETKDDEEDFVLEKRLVCKKIHEHLKICYLEQYTEEDRESVFLVIQMIDELPESQDVSERLQALEESGNDEEYAEYYSSITAHVKHIYSYYVALKTKEKDLRSYVTNSDKLLNLYSVCGINDISLSSLTEVNVQYYAYIDRIKRGNEIANLGNVSYTGKNKLDEGILAVIDTSAEKMEELHICLKMQQGKPIHQLKLKFKLFQLKVIKKQLII